MGTFRCRRNFAGDQQDAVVQVYVLGLRPDEFSAPQSTVDKGQQSRGIPEPVEVRVCSTHKGRDVSGLEHFDYFQAQQAEAHPTWVGGDLTFSRQPTEPGAYAVVVPNDRLCTDLSAAMSEALLALRHRQSGHDPGRVALDLAVMLADGREAIADLAVLRNQSDLFGTVASDATASLA